MVGFHPPPNGPDPLFRVVDSPSGSYLIEIEMIWYGVSFSSESWNFLLRMKKIFRIPDPKENYRKMKFHQDKCFHWRSADTLKSQSWLLPWGVWWSPHPDPWNGWLNDQHPWGPGNARAFQAWSLTSVVDLDSSGSLWGTPVRSILPLCM